MTTYLKPGETMSNPKRNHQHGVAVAGDWDSGEIRIRLFAANFTGIAPGQRVIVMSEEEYQRLTQTGASIDMEPLGNVLKAGVSGTVCESCGAVRFDKP